MKFLWIALGAAAAIAVLILLAAFICFHMAFYAPRRKTEESAEFSIPEGKIYEPFRNKMIEWMKETRDTPHEDVWIRSFDGLKLHGRYYENFPGAPIELMFHGYRGSAERDLCGGMQRCFKLGRNALIVDQRTSGQSDGHVISFGINESRDCVEWIDFMIRRFGPDVKIVLCGISMGAATVMITAGKELPENVVGVLADCGYSSAREIIKKTIHEMKLPPNLLYPLVRLGARIYGRFDPDEISPKEALEKSRVPVIFIHGESDDFVPCDMSRENYSVCASKKRLLTVPNAGHGLAYLVDPEGYLGALSDFFAEHRASSRVK